MAVSCFVHFFCDGRDAWEWAVCPTGHFPERMAEFAEHGQSPQIPYHAGNGNPPGSLPGFPLQYTFQSFPFAVMICL